MKLNIKPKKIRGLGNITQPRNDSDYITLNSVVDYSKDAEGQIELHDGWEVYRLTTQAEGDIVLIHLNKKVFLRNFKDQFIPENKLIIRFTHNDKELTPLGRVHAKLYTENELYEDEPYMLITNNQGVWETTFDFSDNSSVFPIKIVIDDESYHETLKTTLRVLDRAYYIFRQSNDGKWTLIFYTLETDEDGNELKNRLSLSGVHVILKDKNGLIKEEHISDVKGKVVFKDYIETDTYTMSKEGYYFIKGESKGNRIFVINLYDETE